MYINGEPVSSEAQQGAIGVSANDILMAQGNTGVGAQAFDGLVDELAVFSVALTEAEIKDFMKGWDFLIAVAPAGKLATTWAGIKLH